MILSSKKLLPGRMMGIVAIASVPPFKSASSFHNDDGYISNASLTASGPNANQSSTPICLAPTLKEIVFGEPLILSVSLSQYSQEVEHI